MSLALFSLTPPSLGPPTRQVTLSRITYRTEEGPGPQVLLALPWPRAYPTPICGQHLGRLSSRSQRRASTFPSLEMETSPNVLLHMCISPLDEACETDEGWPLSLAALFNK